MPGLLQKLVFDETGSQVYPGYGSVDNAGPALLNPDQPVAKANTIWSLVARGRKSITNPEARTSMTRSLFARGRNCMIPNCSDTNFHTIVTITSSPVSEITCNVLTGRSTDCLGLGHFGLLVTGALIGMMQALMV